MIGPRAHILALLLFVMCKVPVLAQAAGAPVAAEATPVAEIDPELALIKDHLFNNKDSTTRISAASVLLFKEGPAARELVLDVLKQTENPTAKAATCKALDRSRTDIRPLKNREDFLAPLIAILGTETDPTVASLAAEATLMFTYDQVQAGLEKIATDAQMPVKVRTNAIYALQLHPDKRPVLVLIGLMNDPNGTVKTAAGGALTSLGISLPDDPDARRNAIGDLDQQGPEAYLRKRLVRSETDIRDLRASMLAWQTYYFAALDESYASLTDEVVRSNFLAERLKTPEPVIRLWALDKLEGLKQGTGKPKLSEDLEKTVLSLVSSRDKRVRLKTARLLTRMWELNSAQRLLQQLQIEEDAEVRHELFVALGGTCYYASLDPSPFKIPDEVRKETLEWAVRYLNEQRPERVRSGADVLRKLLAQNNLKPEDVTRYLDTLAQRYQQTTVEAAPALRTELLMAMAGLCTQRSICRAQATKLYSPLFEQAVADGAEAVRLAAVDGFISIDGPAALNRLKKSLTDDPVAAIRARLIELAGEVGVAEDLDWLVKKLGPTAEGEAAWRAMLKVFRRSGMDIMTTWTTAIAGPPLDEKLSLEQKVSFFTQIEQRAQSESKVDLLAQSRKRLAELYAAGGNFKQAADYLKVLEDTTGSQQEKEGWLSGRLDVCLRWPNLTMASEIVDTFLVASDMRVDSPMAKSIDNYLREPPLGADPNALLERLVKIHVKEPDARPGWKDLLQQWNKLVAQAKKPAEIQGISN